MVLDLLGFYLNGSCLNIMKLLLAIVWHGSLHVIDVKDFSVHCSSVEISSSLAKKQLETVGEVQTHLSKFRVECRDAADQSGWGIDSYFSALFHFLSPLKICLL